MISDFRGNKEAEKSVTNCSSSNGHEAASDSESVPTLC